MKRLLIFNFIVCILLGKTNSKFLKGFFRSCYIDKIIELDTLCNQKETYECFNLKIMYKSFLKKNNTFHTFEENGIKKIVYSKDKKIYRTTCFYIDKIDIMEDQTIQTPNKCAKDIWIHYKNEANNIVDGFLTKIGVIRKDTEEIDCEESETIFKSFDKSIIIIRKNDLSFLIDSLFCKNKKI